MPAPVAAGAVLEPVAASATPTAPVEVAPTKRPSRARWAVAGLIALVVVALSAAGLFALVGAQNDAVVASWTPSDSMVYLEVRGDLPGDQRQNLGRFLAHFPGFADQSTLDTKIDEALDRLVSRASDGKHDWSKEIKPWFGGQVGMSVSGFPTAGTDSSTMMDGARFLVVATQKDPAAAIGWLKLSGAATTDEAYKGVTLTVFPHDHGPTVVATTTGGVLLVGDETSVKAAVDRNGSDGLASSKTFKTAMSSLSGDQLLRTYVDLKAYFEAFTAMAKSIGGTQPQHRNGARRPAARLGRRRRQRRQRRARQRPGRAARRGRSNGRRQRERHRQARAGLDAGAVRDARLRQAADRDARPAEEGDDASPTRSSRSTRRRPSSAGSTT